MAINLLFRFWGALGIDFPKEFLRNRLQDCFARAAIKEGRPLTEYFASGAFPGNRCPLYILEELIAMKRKGGD